jgi:hypothetical protein
MRRGNKLGFAFAIWRSSALAEALVKQVVTCDLPNTLILNQLPFLLHHERRVGTSTVILWHMATPRGNHSRLACPSAMKCCPVMARLDLPPFSPPYLFSPL